VNFTPFSGTGLPPPALCFGRYKRHSHAAYRRTTARLCARFGKYARQCTGRRYACDDSRELHEPSAQPPTVDDICALEQGASENALPVEFFARVIWRESRFNARAVSRKGAAGIAQFMPATANGRGLADPFEPIEALRHSAGYLRELLDRFGNLGLAAAAYNAGPGRVSAWLTGHRPLPGETRRYVALVTGWTADDWASSSPPEKAETTIPQGVPCTRLANLILAPKQERQRIAAYVPRWGVPLAAHLSESTA